MQVSIILSESEDLGLFVSLFFKNRILYSIAVITGKIVLASYSKQCCTPTEINSLITPTN